MTTAERTEAEKTCGENRECLFDFAVTGGCSCNLPCCTVELSLYPEKNATVQNPMGHNSYGQVMHQNPTT